MSTQVIRPLHDAHHWVAARRQAGRRVSLVPTMGALHEGHLSLVRAAKEASDDVVVSIFVNPTQFGPGEDFERYPRTWESDLASLEQLGVALVFAPAAEQMFPEGATTWVEPSAVAAELEGAHRPGHFRGVATVVLKLFHILPADVAYFGEKDFQQCLVIRDLVRDLNVPLELRFCPTVRESDGLALSSRNRYLSHEQRQQARALWQALQRARELVDAGERDAEALEEAARQTLHEAGVTRVDYVALRDAETLERMSMLRDPAVLLIAAHVGSTRLIDNCRLTVASTPSTTS